MSELTDIVLPPDQSEGSTHEIGQWLKRVGDPVRLDEPVLEIITDKVTVEIAAPAAGVLAEILKEAGERVEKGELLGRILLTTAAPESPVPSAPTEGPTVRPSNGLELSPAVRRLIEEKGLDATKIVGTGRGGRIAVQDVEAYLKAAREPGSRGTRGVPSRRVPHSPQRKSIAEHMVRSMQTAPHVTAVFEADLTRVSAHRNALQGERVTFTAYFVRAAVAALQAVPEVNSRWHADGLELFEDCNIGVAVALDAGGLIVPVLHRAQALDLLETGRRLNDLAARARAGKLEPREVQDGTFTISNHGVSGSLLAAPIVINQPQSAILGVGKVERRPRVNATGGIEARPMAYVTLTIDHRGLDGFQANAFLTRWVETVEQWS
ncbi:MAG TPA: 2-oxo acid dehydrogenase subunit E2 [Gemmatimonadales bacterium]|jgi:2-oxoglutarate dehydrogenase E2 component (dihydrolipoamide succinyltransferase)|nr:2-oxo acid dehydrogenase subunit E2 [Gemmatimonadales bacterium]